MSRRTLRRKNGGRKKPGKRGRKVVPNRRTRKGGLGLDDLKNVKDVKGAFTNVAQGVKARSQVVTEGLKAAKNSYNNKVEAKTEEIRTLRLKKTLLQSIKSILDNLNDNNQLNKLVNNDELVNNAKTSLSELQKELEKPANGNSEVVNNQQVASNLVAQ